MLGIELQSHGLYHGFYEVHAQNICLFLCYEQSWAEHVKEKVEQIIQQEKITTMDLLQECSSFAAMQTEELAAREKWVKSLEDNTAGFMPIDEKDGTTPILIKQKNSEKMLQAHFLAPGLCAVPLTLKEDEPKRQAMSLYAIKTGGWYARFPNLSIIQLVATHVEKLTNWTDKVIFWTKKHTEYLQHLKQELYAGRNLPPLPKELLQLKPKEIDFSSELNELQQFVGWGNFKVTVHRIVQRMQGETKLIANGLIVPSQPYLNMAFMGKVGVGKKSAARLIAKILKKSNCLKTDNVLIVNRSSFYGKTAGEKLENVQKVINSALDGVMLLDDLSVLLEPKDATDHMIASMLMDAIEKHKERLVVILSGSLSHMNQLFAVRDRLRLMIPYVVEFKDFEPQELSQIGIVQLEKKGLDCSLIRENTLEQSVIQYSKKQKLAGNANWMMIMCDRIAEQVMVRTAGEDEIDGCIQEVDVKRGLGLVSEPQDTERLVQLRDEAMLELNQLIGLTPLKERLMELMRFLAVEGKRREKGIVNEVPNLHMTFNGNPGTGKTTVARIVAQFLKAIGWLSQGHLVEVSRADLVAEYVGQTAPKVKKVVERAIGGVLFIDEAYALAFGDTFSVEAVDTLIKEMEDNRGNLVVVLAGYEEPMKRMLAVNPGFVSRIPFHFQFPDYTDQELFEILTLMLSSNHMKMDDTAAEVALKQLTTELYRGNGAFSGNGRSIRNLVERIRLIQNQRLFFEGEADLSSVIKEDIEKAFVDVDKMRVSNTVKNPIGFR